MTLFLEVKGLPYAEPFASDSDEEDESDYEYISW